jgi:hypothetical protein
MDRWILVVGSFGEGHEFYGPFDSREDAATYAFDRSRSGHFVELERPDGRNADGDDWSGPDGRIILLVGDGFNGHSVVGTFDNPESALDYEERYDADNQGWNVLWVELQPMD